MWLEERFGEEHTFWLLPVLEKKDGLFLFHALTREKTDVVVRRADRTSMMLTVLRFVAKPDLEAGLVTASISPVVRKRPAHLFEHSLGYQSGPE